MALAERVWTPDLTLATPGASAALWPSMLSGFGVAGWRVLDSKSYDLAKRMTEAQRVRVYWFAIATDAQVPDALDFAALHPELFEATIKDVALDLAGAIEAAHPKTGPGAWESAGLVACIRALANDKG